MLDKELLHWRVPRRMAADVSGFNARQLRQDHWDRTYRADSSVWRSADAEDWEIEIKCRVSSAYWCWSAPWWEDAFSWQPILDVMATCSDLLTPPTIKKIEVDVSDHQLRICYRDLPPLLSGDWTLTSYGRKSHCQLIVCLASSVAQVVNRSDACSLMCVRDLCSILGADNLDSGFHPSRLL